MGTLCTAVIVLSMNGFGPIADNAGGIVEMAEKGEGARAITDHLDAVGNVTKAMTKGYAVGGSALACFVLFRAFMDDVTELIGEPFYVVDLGKVETLVGGLIGVMTTFVFVGWTISAVGTSAVEIVTEVRRQFNEVEGLREGRARPDYEQCVSIVTKSALRGMLKPALFALGVPVLVGVVFKWWGSFAYGPGVAPHLGVEVVAALMIFETLSGLLMAIFLDNAGGAWDNAKKYIESGRMGGKGSDAHKAAVTGDTVGDPFKDTAGPSLHVIITSMFTTLLVLAPLFVGPTQGGGGGGGGGTAATAAPPPSLP